MSAFIEGVCAEGYEEVRQVFRGNFESGGCENNKEENAQLCIYVGDQLVVDIVGRSDRDSKYTPTSLQVTCINKD